MRNNGTYPGTEELAHMEMICAIVHQLTRNLSMEEIEKSGFDKYYVDHTVGLWPQAAGGIPFNSCEFQVKGDAITDLTEDMAADAAVLETQTVGEGQNSMQKLKNSIIDAMIQLHMTKAEVDFMLELSHHQDETGKIFGVYYKDMCNSINISYDTFYTVMRSLIQKQLISAEKNYREDWDIIILNNDFSQGNYSGGYISTGHDLFYNSKFKSLKANEKLLAMQLFKIIGAGKRYHIGMTAFYQKYCDLLGIARRTLTIYLHSLKKFFKIELCNRNYRITALPGILKSNAPTDLSALSEYLGRTAVRRNRITYTEDAFIDTLFLIKQYGEHLREKTAEVFLRAVSESIELQNGSSRCRWNRNLNPKFVHKLIKKYL